MKTLWMILSVAGGVIALFFAFRGDYEKAFVAAAAGAVCWFLNYRQKLSDSVAEEDENGDSDEEVRS